MITITIEGLPDKRLEPNARCHWGQKAKAAASDRERGGWAVKQVMQEDMRTFLAEHLRSLPALRYRVEIGLPKGAKQRDSDNVAVWSKSIRDGIADLLCGGWDGNWELVRTTQVRDREGPGWVKFHIELGSVETEAA